jgi:hypothetical protein
MSFSSADAGRAWQKAHRQDESNLFKLAEAALRGAKTFSR